MKEHECTYNRLGLRLLLLADRIRGRKRAALSKKEQSDLKGLTGYTVRYSEMEISLIQKDEKVLYAFTEKTPRERVLAYALSSSRYRNITSEDLFGVETPDVMVEDLSWRFDTAYYTGHKFLSKKENVYKVSALLCTYDPETDRSRKVGIVSFIVERKRGARYGFILKKMMLHRTCD